MFSKDMVETLLPVVNDIDIMSRLQDYVKERIEYHRNELENNLNPASQGALKELRVLQKLREHVLDDRKRYEKT